ncbi:prepilin-type N-terminal cleavage/methylation domain-containing protein [Patescibacteria group bacterium]|nr:prepilin-type N-terminal cleavage/methylation domain-containing protein [Patescibacteria group bacterium]MBU2220704.1 prepilin-type N-terminal cleavage/methylation domain-containing protein [Patescibacteria group bacterium]
MIHQQKGFTLVETLVAITIIALALVGPFYAVQQSLNASRSARDQLIASSLAQEGVEYVRAIRDGNYLFNIQNPNSLRSWLYGLNGTGGRNCIAADCVVDATQGTVNTVITPLYVTSGGIYNQQNSGTVTPFTRKIRLTTISVTEVRVTVTMTWMTRTVPYTFTVTETLNDWL